MPRWLQITLIIAVVVIGLTLATPLDNGIAQTKTPAYSPAALNSLLASMHDAHVRTGDSLIKLEGVAPSGDEWVRLLEQFRNSVADGVKLSMDVFVVDTNLPIDDLCARMFAVLANEAIRFRKSASTIRTSSHAALDRLADFARDCRQAKINITGHTDASGDEQNNEALSVARAQAVADYLIARGAAIDQLFVIGAGSALPIADNATAQGRDRNRRIEFELRPAP